MRNVMAQLLILASTRAIASTHMDVIPDASHADYRIYETCVKTKSADFCVDEGDWWTICREQEIDESPKTLKLANVTIDVEHQIKVAGCPFPDVLISKALSTAYGITAEKTVVSGRACSAEVDGWDRSAAVVGVNVVIFEVDEQGRMRSGFAALSSTEAQKQDLCGPFVKLREPLKMWAGPTIPVGLDVDGDWSVDILGDLNGDGSPEVLVRRGLKFFAPNEVALLVTPRDALDVMATTVSTSSPLIKDAERRVALSVGLDRAACEHWAGEEPYDKERADEISLASKKSCDAYRQSLEAARKLYPKNADLKTWAAEK